LLSEVFTTESKETHRKKLTQVIESGKAYEIFCRLAVDQGAHLADVERKNRSWLTKGVKDFPAESSKSGVITSIDTRALGEFLVQCGAGRSTLKQKVNPKVGLHSIRKIGDQIQEGEPLCFLRVPKEHKDLAKKIETLFQLNEENAQTRPRPSVAEWITPQTH
jgi:thymidine phosphorylase